MAINNPPNPSVETRDTERPPLCCQATSMPFGSATRANPRFTACETFGKGNLISWTRVLFILGVRTSGDNRLWRDASLTRQHRGLILDMLFVRSGVPENIFDLDSDTHRGHKYEEW